MGAVVKRPKTQTAKVDVILRVELLKAYESEHPRPTRLDEWFEEKATEFGLSVQQVRTVIAQQAEWLDFQIRQKTARESESIAMLLGANKTKVINTLLDALENAKKGTVLIDRETGDACRDDKGKPKIVWMPDYRERINAAKELSQIHGAYAPFEQDIKVTQTDEYSRMSEEELLARLSKERRELEARGIHVVDVTARVAGEDGAQGPALLASELHKDEGRAGPGESVQGVS